MPLRNLNPTSSKLCVSAQASHCVEIVSKTIQIQNIFWLVDWTKVKHTKMDKCRNYVQICIFLHRQSKQQIVKNFAT